MNQIGKLAVVLSKKLFDNKIFINSMMISVVSIAVGMINFLFNIIAANILSKEMYGEYTSLYALLMIIVLPSSALQFVMSKEVSILVHENKWGILKAYIARMMKILLFFLVIILLLLFLSLPFLKNYFHIQNNMAFILVFAQIPLTILIIPFYSLLQSRERFHIYIYYSIFGTLTKFVFGIGLVYLMVSYYGILWGLLVSQIISISFLSIDYFRFKEIRFKTDVKTDKSNFFEFKRFIRSFFYALLSVGAFQLLTYLDMVQVKHFFSAAEAGIYGTVNLIGKASFFLATAFSYVLLPLMAKDRENMNKSNQRALFLLFSILFLYALFLCFTSSFISKYIYSNNYAGMEKILPLYGFMFLPYAMISFLVNYYVISENLFYSFTILAGAVLQVIGIYLFHQSLIQVTIVVGVCGYIILTALLIDSQIMERIKKKDKK